MIKNIKKNHNDLFFLETKRERERVVCLFYLFLIVFAKSTKESTLILLFEIEFKPPPQKKKNKKKRIPLNKSNQGKWRNKVF